MSHFHALGRILYNKRTSAGDAADPAQGRWGGGSTSPGGEGPLSGSYGAPRCGNGFAELAAEVWKWEGDVRPELAREKMERDPEDVVARSGLDAMAVLGYLLENYHHFVHEWHVDEAAQAAASLSGEGQTAPRRSRPSRVEGRRA